MVELGEIMEEIVPEGMLVLENASLYVEFEVRQNAKIQS